MEHYHTAGEKETIGRQRTEKEPGWRKGNPENIYPHQLQQDLQNKTPALQRFVLGE